MPFPSPGDLLDPGIEPASLASPELAGGFFMTELPDMCVCVCVCVCVSRIQLFVTLWIVAHQATLSMEFSRQ